MRVLEATTQRKGERKMAKTVKLNLNDAHRVLYTLRLRQDDARRVKPDMPNYEIYRTLEVELEMLKMKIVKQMG